ncbi:MAG: TerC/Alx family metal homeostasis membrane protein [Planctomycetes bacterium]|nr:TerC/Alx family metal homeostasis membrane protein [Planctomycetota bacterium]
MTVFVWIGFIVMILGMLALDLGVFHRRDAVISLRASLGWTAVWVAVSLLFNVGIYFMYDYHLLGIGERIGTDLGGRQAAMEFLSGYLIEKSLSIDNIFVIAAIFSYFHVPEALKHRVLFWGVLGALVLRGAMIGVGAALINRFEWLEYVLGAVLIVTALKMLFAHESDAHPDRNPLVKLARKFYPVTRDYEGHHFFSHLGGRRAITPLMLVLLAVESMDAVFAVDSIPAIFGVTREPFIVFTSNVFAVLGLRSLYFALAAVLDRFEKLKYSLVFILIFVGVKMLISHWVAIETWFSLAVIVVSLATGMVVSMMTHGEANDDDDDADEPGA